MKKFLLLVFATLSIASCTNKYTIGSSNGGNSTENNNDSIVSKQNEDTYTIRFLNDEGSLISTKQYEFGVMPEAPDAPSKENPLEGYTYTFSGWSPSIALVTADADYVATYEAEAKVGEVVWVDGNGKTLLTEEYAYGSMPNYHGDIPTKTATATETYVFKGWSPSIEIVSKSTITYVATFNAVPIVPETQYSIKINCTDCLVNKKKSINEKHAPLSDLTYQFNKTSKETYHYPYKLDVTVDGVSTNDYTYDSITGKLNIRLIGDTIINAIADNSCALMKYKYSSTDTKVNITCDGNFEYVDWGDGTIDTSKSHNYSYSFSVNQYDIRIFGKLTNIGTTSEAIKSVNIFHSVTSIGDSAFRSCSSLTSIIIPNSVASIGESAFSSCSSLTSITIPNSVTSIGRSAFSSCSSLASITIPNSVTEISDLAFYGCSSLTSITIPNRVTSIGDGAFCVCSSLASITIPNSVTEIRGSAFSGCSSLISINIPNGVTSIGDTVFWNCSSLTSITIPNSVTSIGNSAFRGCSSLEKFDLSNLDHVINIESGIFSSSYVPTIKVSADMIDDYKAHSVWKQYENKIVVGE